MGAMLRGQSDVRKIARLGIETVQIIAGRSPMKLRATLAALCAVLALACVPAHAQPNWPAKPVKIVSPFAAGGTASTLARLIADHLSAALGQQFYVENRGGAGGLVGTASVASAEPDGYTLLISSIGGNIVSPAFHDNTGFDGLKDFTHIAYLGGPPVVLIVHPSLGVMTYKDFVALARRSEALSYISPGTGSHGFVVGEDLARRENYKLRHIPYKGAGPALTDLVAGHVKVGTMTFSTAAPQIRAGKVLALAVTSEKRIPDFPNIPTFRDMGQDFVAATWFGLSGPARLPNDIVQAVSRETLKAMQLPEMQKRLALDAIETRLMSPDEFRKFVEAETARWVPLAKSLAAMSKK
jgi:tripartite-type tricarboxylate transporter receptor subunit TctC